MNPSFVGPSATGNVQKRVEQLRQSIQRGQYKAVLFDFDGTLSGLRAGWPQVMVQVLWDYWQAAGLSAREPEPTQRQLLQLVLSTNGMPPLQQMQVFVQMVRDHGGAELDPSECVVTYQQRLGQLIQRRHDSIRQGETTPQQWLVPGAWEVLMALHQWGLKLFLTSGTEYEQVYREAELLGLLPFFPHAIFAPHGHDHLFSKGQILDHLLQQYHWPGETWLGFGDGVVEIREVKRVGGTAIGLATPEVSDSPLKPPWAKSHDPCSASWWDDPTVADKCHRLLAAGADMILPHYLGLVME